MYKENLLKHQIAEVEKAGYYVVPYERVQALTAQSTHDLMSLRLLEDPDGYKKYAKRELLTKLAAELAGVVRWDVERSERDMREITRVTLTVVLPPQKKDNSNEVSPRVPRFADAPGYNSTPYRR